MSSALESYDPLAVILISSGSRGDRLLFRYPYESDESQETTLQATPTKNPYALKIAEDFGQPSRPALTSHINNSTLVGYTDKILRNLLAIKADLCERKFEVKINDVFFVGFPMMVQQKEAAALSFNVVFCLRASSDESLRNAYQDLAKQIALTLRHEERRCEYMSEQKTLMLSIQDEVATMTEDSIESPFRIILQRSSLAKQIKTIYDELCHLGVVLVYINQWLRVSFCLPHKLHNLHLHQDSKAIIKPEVIQKCIAALRPYHALLLLQNENLLLEQLPPDSSPSLTRLVQVATPLKSIQRLASDADLSLGQTFQLVTHLVYWGKAIIIYPLCESNVYTLAPNISTYVNSWLGEKFSEMFPGMTLSVVLAEFSLPTPLHEHRDVLGLPQHQTQQVQMVVWMLQQRLLVQLHTYVFLAPVPTLHKNRSDSLRTDNPLLRSDSVLSSSLEDQEALKVSSNTEINSALSEGSPDQSTFSTFSTKSPSVEVTSNGTVITEDMRKQWHLRDTLLSTLTAGQRQLVLQCRASNNPDNMKLFVRLCPYFNGKHHLEEIMYYENVRRSQLLELLDKFRDVLITCQHEDPATTCLAT